MKSLESGSVLRLGRDPNPIQGPTDSHASTLRVAIVEADPSQAALFSHWLKQAGHRCHRLADVEALIRALGQIELDAVLLDWGLVRSSKIDVPRCIRRSDRPSLPIMVSGPDREDDVVRALSQGADDYLAKPARRLQLLGRLEAIARRGNCHLRASTVIKLGSVRVDYQARTVLYGERRLQLTRKEFELLVLLLRNAGRLLSRAHLLESVWGPKAQVTSRAIDTNVYRLRRKLALALENGWRLTTVYGRGYRLVWLSANAALIRFPSSRPAPKCAPESSHHSERYLKLSAK